MNHLPFNMNSPMIEKKFNVSIVIPAYNEEGAISMTLKKLSEEPRLLDAEIIVVNDGSVDSTASKVAAYPNVRLVEHHVNKGYGASLITGTRHSTCEYIFWCDADGQHRVEDLMAVIEKTVTGDLDYCIGVRDTDSHHVKSRKFGKWFLRQAVQLAASEKVMDFNSGLRGFRKEVIWKYLHLLPKGFGASTTTTLLMLERDFKGAEVPITVQPRIGQSSVRQIRDGLGTILLILRIFLLFKPLHFFGGAGALMCFIGFGYGMWTAIMEGLGVPVLGAVVFLAGMQTMFLGLIMDQISAMRREKFDR